MPPPISPFPFFQLPRELRDCTYSFFLRSAAEPPPFPVASHGPSTYPYRKAPLLTSTALPLLLSCRRVRDELQAVMARAAADIDFVLDTAVYQDGQGYSTMFSVWLALPMPLRYLRRLRLSLRVGPSEHDELMGNGRWRDDFRTRYLNALHAFLWRLFRRGPALVKADDGAGGLRLPPFGRLEVALLSEPGERDGATHRMELYHAKVDEMLERTTLILHWMVAGGFIPDVVTERIALSRDGKQLQEWTIQPKTSG